MNFIAQKEYILLIEDSAADIDLLMYALDMKQFSGEVKVLNYGKEALNFLYKSKDALPEIIVMDLSLPDISGLELLEEIKQLKACSEIPILIWSGVVSPRDINECQRLGTHLFLPKPLDLTELESQASRMLKIWNKERDKKKEKI